MMVWRLNWRWLKLLALSLLFAVFYKIIKVFELTWHIAIWRFVWRGGFCVRNAKIKSVRPMNVMVLLRLCEILMLRTFAHQTQLWPVKMFSISIAIWFTIDCCQEAGTWVHSRRWTLPRKWIARIEADLNDVGLVVLQYLLLIVVVSWERARSNSWTRRTFRFISRQAIGNLIEIITFCACDVVVLESISTI